MEYEDHYSGRNSAARYTLVKINDDSDAQYVDIQGWSDDKPTKVMRIQPHGFASTPIADAHLFGVHVGNSRDRIFLLGGEHANTRQRNVPQGTAVLYDDKGNVIFAKGRDGIQVIAKNGDIIVKAPDDKKIYLGGDPKDGQFSPVSTVDGPSPFVLARTS